MSDWQPIATAPLDETTVDLWIAGDPGYRMCGSWWHPGDEVQGAGWWDMEADFGGGDVMEEWVRVTHWMLPPRPPE